MNFIKYVSKWLSGIFISFLISMIVMIIMIIGAIYTDGFDGFFIVFGMVLSIIVAMIMIHLLSEIGWFPSEGRYDIRYRTVGFAENTIWARIGRIGRGK